MAAVVFAQRELLGLRQEELADLAGCSARFVHDVEAGKATVQLDKVLELLDALGLGLAVVEGASGVVVGAGSDSRSLAQTLGLSPGATDGT